MHWVEWKTPEFISTASIGDNSLDPFRVENNAWPSKTINAVFLLGWQCIDVDWWCPSERCQTSTRGVSVSKYS